MLHRYGENWRDVKSYLEEIPAGFTLNRFGQDNIRDNQVKRLRNWREVESLVWFDPEIGSPENSAYLRFQSLIRDAGESIREKAHDAGLLLEIENAGNDAGEIYADETESFSDEFYDWCESQPEICSEWYGNHIQDNANYIGGAVASEACVEKELLIELWYWYKAGHWPCGWEGDWPEGRLVVF